MKHLKPLFFENNKIPVWLSKVAPIEIWAVSIFIFVFCKGELSEDTRRHETIHFQQQLELLFVGQWIIYAISWLWGLLKYRDGKTAYYRNIAEQEAYENESNPNYLTERKRWQWLWKYKS